MSRTEYKTVAMPQLVRGRSRRGQSRGEMIAETLSRVINEQGQSGWSYVGADHFRTIERASLFRASEEVVYTVLVFERPAHDHGARAEPPFRSESEDLLYDVQPEPMRAREPEPKRAREPEPIRAREPEPMRAREPEPKRVRDAAPVRARDAEPSRVRSSEPVRAREPEPKRQRDAEGLRARDPEPRPRSTPRREVIDDDPAPRRRPGEGFVRRRSPYDDT